MTIWIERKQLLLQLGFAEYREYLDSPIWKEIRKKVLLRDNNICLCGSPAKQVHHRKYLKEDLLGTTLDNLVSLCKPCHLYASRDNNNRVYTPVESEIRLNNRLVAIKQGDNLENFTTIDKIEEKRLKRKNRKKEKKQKIREELKSLRKRITILTQPKKSKNRQKKYKYEHSYFQK